MLNKQSAEKRVSLQEGAGDSDLQTFMMGMFLMLLQGGAPQVRLKGSMVLGQF